MNKDNDDYTFLSYDEKEATENLGLQFKIKNKVMRIIEIKQNVSDEKEEQLKSLIRQHQDTLKSDEALLDSIKTTININLESVKTAIKDKEKEIKSINKSAEDRLKTDKRFIGINSEIEKLKELKNPFDLKVKNLEKENDFQNPYITELQILEEHFEADLNEKKTQIQKTKFEANFNKRKVELNNKIIEWTSKNESTLKTDEQKEKSEEWTSKNQTAIKKQFELIKSVETDIKTLILKDISKIDVAINKLKIDLNRYNLKIIEEDSRNSKRKSKSERIIGDSQLRLKALENNIVEIPVLQLDEFYSADVEIINQNFVKEIRRLYLVRTRDNNKQLNIYDEEELIGNLQRIIKEAGVRDTEENLRIFDFIKDESYLLEKLYHTEHKWATIYGYDKFNNKYIKPGDYELVRPIYREGKINYDKIDYTNLSDFEFYKRTYNKDKIQKIIEQINLLPRFKQETINYKLIFSASMAEWFRTLFTETPFIGAIRRGTGIAKSTPFKIGIGEMWGSYIPSSQIYEQRDINAIGKYIKEFIPDFRIRYKDEVGVMANSMKEFKKERATNTIPSISKGIDATSTIHYITPWKECETSNTLNAESFSDINDKYLNMNFEANANYKGKNNITNQQYKELMSNIKELGAYIYNEVILKIDAKKIFDKLNNEINPISRNDNHYLYFKFGEQILDELNLFKQYRLTKKDIVETKEQNLENIYSEADTVKEAIVSIIGDIEKFTAPIDNKLFNEEGQIVGKTSKKYQLLNNLKSKGFLIKTNEHRMSLILEGKAKTYINNQITRSNYNNTTKIKSVDDLTTILNPLFKNKLFKKSIKYYWELNEHEEISKEGRPYFKYKIEKNSDNPVKGLELNYDILTDTETNQILREEDDLNEDEKENKHLKELMLKQEEEIRLLKLQIQNNNKEEPIEITNI